MQCKTWPFWEDNLKSPGALENASELRADAPECATPALCSIRSRTSNAASSTRKVRGKNDKMTNDKCQMTMARGRTGTKMRAVAEPLPPPPRSPPRALSARPPAAAAAFEHGHCLYDRCRAAPFPPTPKNAAASHCAPTSSASPVLFAGKIEGRPTRDQQPSALPAKPALGCRIYFCDESARGWENDLYEKKYHRMLRCRA